MKLIVKPSSLSGSVDMPGSKSHTIRCLVVGTLAEGTTTIDRPLDSADTRSCVAGCRALGATVETPAPRSPGDPARWTVYGTGGTPSVPENIIDIGNSGTSLRLLTSAAALAPGYTVFTGDYQVRRRPMAPLLASLQDLGASAFSTRPGGKPPIVVQGPLSGGITTVDGTTSQYLSSLLIASPLCPEPVTLNVSNLNEKPYVDITLSYLDRQGIRYEHDGLEHFAIEPGQAYHGTTWTVPADFSSATFFLVAAAAVPESRITLTGLDTTDVQGDKAVLDYLQALGASVEVNDHGRDGIVVSCAGLTGTELDLNATPDALPALAVAGCLSDGETRLVNVPQARLKETDRIEVMTTELRKMGGDVSELEDGMVIQHSSLKGAVVDGHDDHRVVMALAVAACAATGRTVIEGAEAMSITFPTFVDLMTQLGASIELVD